MLLQWVTYWGACLWQVHTAALPATLRGAQSPCVCRQLPGCPQTSVTASIPSGQVHLPEIPPTDAWVLPPVHQHLWRYLFPKAVLPQAAPLPGHHGTEIQEKRPVELCQLASWVSVCRKNADWRAINSQGSCFSRERVMCCSWPFASGKDKHSISLSCDAGQEKLPKVRIAIVYLDRCSCPLLCLPSRSCLVLHLLKEVSAPRMCYLKCCL